MEDNSPYQILGVEPTATDEEIKAAYRKRARELHPDRNRNDPFATQKFQKLVEAYEILRDPQKREAFDRYGKSGDQNQQTNISEEEGFNVATQLLGLGSTFSVPTGKKVPNTFRMFGIPVSMIFHGGVVKNKIKLLKVCDECNGTGSNDGIVYAVCEECNGNGSLLPGMFRHLAPCKSCNTVGHMIPKDKICKKCGGHKVVEVEKEIEVNVEMGQEDMKEIVLNNMGNEYPGKKQADLVLLTYSIGENGFSRISDDMYYVKNITNTEMATGTSFTLYSPSGKVFNFHTKKDQPIEVDRYCIVKNEGFPCRGNMQFRGNLYIRFSPPLLGVFNFALNTANEIVGAIKSIFRKEQSNSIELEYISAEEQERLKESQ